MNKKKYKKELKELQIELVKFQKSVIADGKKVCFIFEGRDASGKDGTIKRFCEHLSPRDVRTVALGKPSNRDNDAWYFQRFVPHLPVSGEIVFFNRSWYNRSGVERVMGFCNEHEYEKFMEEVGDFEHLLTHDDMHFFKYYIDISKEEQNKRLEARKDNPLKQWKLSPIDQQSQKMWNEYSNARNTMFVKTDFVYAPWYIIHTNSKKRCRINTMKHFLSHVDYPEKDEKKLIYDSSIVFVFDSECHKQGLITR